MVPLLTILSEKGSTIMMLTTAEKVADIVKIVNMKMLMIDNYNEDNK